MPGLSLPFWSRFPYKDALSRLSLRIRRHPFFLCLRRCGGTSSSDKGCLRKFNPSPFFQTLSSLSIATALSICRRWLPMGFQPQRRKERIIAAAKPVGYGTISDKTFERGSWDKPARIVDHAAERALCRKFDFRLMLRFWQSCVRCPSSIGRGCAGDEADRTYDFISRPPIQCA